jgi:L-lactate permease
MGIPIIVAGQVTGIDPFKIGQMAGRQLPLHDHPGAVLDHGDHGRLARREGDLACRAGGRRLSFAVVQFLTANYIGPELPDITSAIVSPDCADRFLKVWQAQAHLPF